MIAECAPSLLAASPMPKTSADPVHLLRLQPDVREALDQGTKIVSPDWALECQQVGRRLPESDFDPQHMQQTMPKTGNPCSSSILILSYTMLS